MQQSGAGTGWQGAAPGREELAASARGWHTIQMAVLGFIGICGVLRTTGSSPAPRAVEWLAAALAVAALVVACLAVFTVGRVAYPVTATASDASASPGAPAAARLRAGIRLTVVALILAVIRRPFRLVAIGGRDHRHGHYRHHRPGLVRPARGRASRCHQCPYRQRRHRRARPAIAQVRPVAACP